MRPELSSPPVPFLGCEFHDPFCRELHRQIEITFRGGAFDACAVLCRRLAEVLLLRVFCAAGHRDRVFGRRRGWSSLGTLIGLVRSRQWVELPDFCLPTLSRIKALGNDGAHHPTSLVTREELEAVRGAFLSLVTVCQDLLEREGSRPWREFFLDESEARGES